MATNSLQQWNPQKNNQETTQDFINDPTRQGGASDPQPFPSNLANKLFYQGTTVDKALGDALALKGFDVSDDDVSQLTVVFSNILTTRDLKPPLITVPWGPSLQFDASKADGFEVVLLGSVTSSVIINVTVGQVISFVFHQGPGYGFVWPTNVVNPGDISSAPNGSVCMQSFRVISDNTLRPITPLSVN